MTDDLLQKVTRAIESTGFPLELETAATAERLGWIAFHSVEYEDPETKKLRELDLMIYKIIRGRRVELRVSCKSSKSSQFVFFTRKNSYIHNVSSLIITPVSDNIDERRSVPQALKPLRFFAHDRLTVNYTVLRGDKIDRDARALLRDALMSTVTSVHHRILPYSLMHDRRGTIYLFVVVLKGRLFDAKHDDATGKSIVEECDYARWSGLIPIPQEYHQLVLSDAEGQPVPFSNALYWFGSRIHVEFVKNSSFESYLCEVENAFGELDPDAYDIFGKPWAPENFPKVGPRPSLGPVRRNEDQKGVLHEPSTN